MPGSSEERSPLAGFVGALGADRVFQSRKAAFRVPELGLPVRVTKPRPPARCPFVPPFLGGGFPVSEIDYRKKLVPLF